MKLNDKKSDSSNPSRDANDSSTKQNAGQPLSRRLFLNSVGVGTLALGLQQFSCKGKADEAAPAIQGFEQTSEKSVSSKVWVPVSDRKIRVGLVGYGVCKFAAAFGFQHH